MKLLITKRAKQSIRGLYLQALRKSLNKYVELNSLLSSFECLMNDKPLIASFKNDGVIAEWREKGYSIFETEYNFVRKQDKGNGDVQLAFKKAKSKDDYKRKWYFAGLYDSRRRTLYIADAVYAPYINRPKKELPSAYNFMLAMRSLISRQYNAKVKQLNLPFTNESKVRIGLNEIKQIICEAIIQLESHAANPYFVQNQIANNPQLFDKLIKDYYNLVGGKFSMVKLADYIVDQLGGKGSLGVVRDVISKQYYKDYKDYFIEQANNSQLLEILRDPEKLLIEIEKAKQYAENNFDVFTIAYFSRYLCNGDYKKGKSIHTTVSRYIAQYKYKDYFESFDFSNPIYSIYCFQDLEEHAVYVGLTRNLGQRINTHKTGMFHDLPSHSTVYNHFKEKGEEVPDAKILQENLTAVEAQMQESYWVGYFYDKGFKILNIAETGALGGFIQLGRYQKKYNYAKQQLKPGQVIDKDYLINLFPKQKANGKTEGELLYNYFLYNRVKYNLDWEISFRELPSQEEYDKKFEEAKAKAAEVGKPFTPGFLQTYGRRKDENGKIKLGPYNYIYVAYRKWKANPNRSKFNFSYWKKQFDNVNPQEEYDKKFEEAKAKAAEIGKPFTLNFLIKYGSVRDENGKIKYGPYYNLYRTFYCWQQNKKEGKKNKYDFSHWEKQFDNYSESQNNNQLMNNNNVQYGQ